MFRFPMHRPARCLVLAALLVVACSLAALTAQRASAAPFLPKHHRIYHGVTDTSHIEDFRNFRHQVRAHPAVLQEFYHWDVSLKYSGAFRRWRQADALGVLSMSNEPWAGGPRDISPRQIAKGRGDHYLIRLNQSIDSYGKPVYFRLFPEMNGSWNPYCAFDASGAPRDPAHSTHWFRKAWQRFVMIVRGGSRKGINRRLHRRNMPRILRARSGHDPIYQAEGVGRVLDDPKVAFMWVPQTTGSPNVRGNAPGNYWPGKAFVDWVGVDIYSKFRSAAFPLMKSFYRHWRGFPFLIGEYSPWDDDFSGSFTRHLFRWAQHADRVRMLIYYRDITAHNPFTIENYPGAKHSLRKILNRRRYDPYAAQIKRHHHRHHHHHHHH